MDPFSPPPRSTRSSSNPIGGCGRCCFETNHSFVACNNSTSEAIPAEFCMATARSIVERVSPLVKPARPGACRPGLAYSLPNKSSDETIGVSKPYPATDRTHE